MDGYDGYLNIAKDMAPEARATLARFRAAAKIGKKLPVLPDTLPAGFLHCTLEEDGVVGTLTRFGMRVALAAEILAQSENAA